VPDTALPSPYLTVPLRLNAGRSGALDLTVVPAHLTAEERQVFETLVTAAALAIERDRLAAEERATLLARESDNLKRALLAMVSHDLRTPLTSIKATASGLLEEDVSYDTAAMRQFLATIDCEADRMLGLVSNLLDLSRIEAGALSPDAEWYEPEEVIGTAIGSLLPRLSGHRLVRAMAPRLPLVRCDYVHLVQVLTNLLENAARYAPAGSMIVVEARACGEQVLITVSDTGPGVLLEERRLIFDAFVRGSAARATEVRGSGLGLAICKGLVEANGGRIWVDEAAGGGAAFTVALPAQLSGDDQSVPPPLPEDEYASGRTMCLNSPIRREPGDAL
jgi:two-component system sensor histidine kinase KdpD